MTFEPKGTTPANNVLLKQSDQYEGQYVALDSVVNGNVLAHGEDILQVHYAAQQKGLERPIVIFVPKKDCVYVY